MKGQMELIPRPLIYSLSLTCYKTICPYCKLENPDGDNVRSWVYGYPFRNEPVNICPRCGNKYDVDNIKEIKSKEYIEAERSQSGNYRELGDRD